MTISFNNNWLFTDDFEAGFENAEPVRLPHTACEIPYNYIDCNDYQMLCGYKKSFFVPDDWCGKRILLRLDGAAHDATVYCNGHEAAHHACGYTAFTADLTDHIKLGEQNTVTVRLDTRESLNIPPFGFVIDYLCYGGLYREAFLEVRNDCYIKAVSIENTDLKDIAVKISTSDNLSCGKLITDILDADGKIVSSAGGAEFELTVQDGKLWSTHSPYLYTLRSRITDGEAVLDEKTYRFGLRTARFENDGFYLNGSKMKLRGINRHQSFAYTGYAMPKSMQRYDADILKYELGVNAVRTSHYPQSQHFIDRCDELGILVFTEIPGWQHIGDDAWKEQAVENTREMVEQYMHHPSIILWGVRINESQDDDELYKKTNAVAHKLDRSRQTSGVRYIEKSSLLEDVYAFNDFSHSGKNAGLKAKKSVTSDKRRPYLVSECNGHMFPTKPFDDERHRLSHALRHARVLDAMYAAEDICGIFPWCMFDYNTHKDFGSGDGICYHGVMDMFRNPKLAASVFASQSDAAPCCVVSSSMDIGEHPAGDLGSVHVFTNADSIRLYKNGLLVKEFYPDRKNFSALPHPPVVIDDFIGNLLETQEGYDRKTADCLKDCLGAIAKYGTSALPPKYIIKLARLMLFKGLRFSYGVELYGKYVSNWGGEATEWRFDAIKDGKVVKSVTKKPGRQAYIEVEVSHTRLVESDTYDVAAVRIRATDEYGNPAVYYQEPVCLSCSDNISIIGPDIISLKGGCGGTYVKTKGVSGHAELKVDDILIKFNVETTN
ncbi:MAG: glycoside hydrolase family 2 TIM barrel-domain containing protein [Oscillospiraceae bacterium]|nr:glycoside hydrolase family 2 TIM barrel-domain containing protein [Oscillospiraceae bacterium]